MLYSALSEDLNQIVLFGALRNKSHVTCDLLTYVRIVTLSSQELAHVLRLSNSIYARLIPGVGKPTAKGPSSVDRLDGIYDSD